MENPIRSALVDKIASEMVRKGLITAEQLAVAKVAHEDLGEDLGKVLVKKGFVTEQEILSFLAENLAVPCISLKNRTMDRGLVQRLPREVAKKYHLIPVEKVDGVVTVAMSDPLDLFAMDDLKKFFPSGVKPVLASASEIEEGIESVYQPPRAEISFSGSSISSEDDFLYPQEGRRLEEIATGPKVIQAVNDILAAAYQEEASDIHIEPRADGVQVRYRLDGLLEDRHRFSREMHLPVISRIKILSNLDIAERRVPQDGRLRVRMKGKPVDMRVSTYPTVRGEKVVLRILTPPEPIRIENLGFSEKDRQTFAEMISRSYGIFLVTGPTGSGKSTTLYAALERLNSPSKNIVSIEDPVEREIPGISQAQVNLKAGITFASALRSILRQDPDIIMLGEIRDRETAEIAVRAAITGHLVLSTLHTNSTAGSIARLLDLGVEPFLLSSALVGVMAQRLVRKVCSHCREKMPAEGSSLGPLAGRLKKVYRGKGCPRCRLSGYSGRVGIFELAPIRGELLTLINRRAPEQEIDAVLRKLGVRSIVEDGVEKIESGITTPEEVLRVIREE